jgi:hypothetical protein
MTKHDNLKMLAKIRKQLSQDLDKMTPQQREKFFEGTKDVYEGLKKMAKVRHSIVK